VAPPDAEGVLRIGTRGSRLALWQADEVAKRIRQWHPDVVVERHVIRTAGDGMADLPAPRLTDKGLFTTEIENALVAGSIDLAVHSLKDLPTRLPEGLILAAILEREDPRDALVAFPGATLPSLPAGTRIGTASLRRRAQALHVNRGLVPVEVRGNVPTRLDKLNQGQCDALILARAGLIRLGLDARISSVIDAEVMVPAPGQGAMAVEIRADDIRAARWLLPLDHAPTRLATSAERAVLARVEGGCQVPVGALGTWSGNVLELAGVIADLDGLRVVKDRASAQIRTEAAAVELGTRLAERLLAHGGAEILDRVRASWALDPEVFKAEYE
jgi:hydroxymethylbilane synthase